MIQQTQTLDRKQTLLTKFPGLFESYKPKTWQIDSYNKLLLCYDTKDPSSKKQNYNIAHLKVQEGDKSTAFIINLEMNRRIYLQAPTEAMKKEWIRVITQIKKIIKGQPKKRVTSSFRMNEQKSPRQKQQTGEGVVVKKPKGINFSTMIAKETLKADENALKEAGLYQFTKYLDEKFIQYNIMSGFHRVKSKDLFPVYKERFLILISPKSLYPHMHVTDVMLLQTQLPPWFSMNTLYQFNINKSKRNEILKVKQILDVSEVSYQSQYNVLRINMGKVIHTLGFDSFAMANKWRGLLLMAKKNSEEIELNGKIIKKNIDPIVVEFMEKKLDKRLTAFYESNRPVNSTVPELMEYLNKTKFELESVCEAAHAKQPPENQLISFYFNDFHWKIFIEIKLTWDKRWETMPPIDMVEIVKWLEDYCSTFINYISDTQMQQGIVTLCKIIGRRVSKQLRPLILSIAQTDKDNNSFQQDGILYTNSIIDLFKFVNDSINIYYTPKCSKQLMWMFCVLASTSFKTYITCLKQTVDNNKLPINQLIAVTNNAGWFITLISEFVEERVESSGMDQESIKVYLQSQQLCRSFMDLATITKQQLSYPYVDKVIKYYRGRKYLSVNLENILRMVFEYEAPIHFLSSINQKGLWKIVLQCIINEIIRCVANSFDKSTKDILKKTIDKIHEELNLLLSEFEEMVGTAAQNVEKEKVTKVLIVLTTQDKQSILDVFKCKEFKEDASIKKLIEYRGDSQWLQKIVMKELEEEIGEGRIRKSTLRKSAKGRKSTIFQNFGVESNHQIESSSDSDEEEESNHQYSIEEVSTVDNTPTTISQGYMEKKKKDKRAFFEQRYFRLKKGVLYWFANESSSICQNQINLKEIEGEVIRSDKRETFTLKINSYGKLSEYKFKCQSFELRELWVKSLEIERKQLGSVKQNAFKPIKVQERSTLINDYDLNFNPNMMYDQFTDQKRNLHNSTIALKKPRDSGKNSRKVSSNNLVSKQETKPTGVRGFFYGLFG